MTHLPMKGRRSSSIYLMKVAGALVKPKGMINHSNNPYLVLKVIFHTSVDSIGIWWYPDLWPSFVKTLAPFRLLMSSSIRGRWYLFFTEILLRARLSMHMRQVPSFLGTRMIGLPQGEEMGCIWPLSIKSYIFLQISSFSRMGLL